MPDAVIKVAVEADCAASGTVISRLPPFTMMLCNADNVTSAEVPALPVLVVMVPHDGSRCESRLQEHLPQRSAGLHSRNHGRRTGHARSVDGCYHDVMGSASHRAKRKCPVRVGHRLHDDAIHAIAIVFVPGRPRCFRPRWGLCPSVNDSSADRGLLCDFTRVQHGLQPELPVSHARWICRR
jgi:hypothetical protein